jgi:cytokinin dehydrogenase
MPVTKPEDMAQAFAEASNAGNAVQVTHTTNRLSRRGLMKTLASGMLVIGFNPLSRSWITAAQAATAADFATLPPLDGTLHIDDATRAEYAQDYGQIIHERPLAVLKPGSVQDISRMVQFARRHGIRIAARGQGHSPFGQAQVRGGLMIDMRLLQTVHAIASDRLEADAGIQWRELVQAALAHGLTAPVLTNYLGLTVGGTLSIGGISPATSRYGAQVDGVLELQVITGEGKIVSCSDIHNRDLFEAALAGQGQCAVITRAVVRLVPAPASIREYVLPYADLRTLLQDAAQLAEEGRFDGMMARLQPAPSGAWAYYLIGTRDFTPPDTPDNTVLLAGLSYLHGAEQVNDYSYLQYVDSIPRWVFEASRPDLGLYVPGSAAAAFLDELLPRLTPTDLGAAAMIRLFLWTRAPFTRPLFRLPAAETIVYLAILRTQTSDPGVVDHMLGANRTLFELNRSLGGTHYPFSALRLSRQDWERHYGSSWGQLVTAKQRHDPDNIFASGPDIF